MSRRLKRAVGPWFHVLDHHFNLHFTYARRMGACLYLYAR